MPIMLVARASVLVNMERNVELGRPNYTGAASIIGDVESTSARIDDERKREFDARLKQAQAIFKANDRFPGMTTDEFMAMIREPLQPFELSDGE